MVIRGTGSRLREKREAVQAEAAALENSGRARVEDLSVFRVKKETNKGKEYKYWHAAWMVEGKVRNVYLGSGKKMSREEALPRTRREKELLGIEMHFSKYRHFRTARVSKVTLQAIQEWVQPGQVWALPRPQI